MYVGDGRQHMFNLTATITTWQHNVFVLFFYIACLGHLSPRL